MAYNFQTKKTATLTATLTGTSKQINIAGCNPDETSADNAVAQTNKLLGIAGKSITADVRTELTIRKGAVLA